MILLLGMHPKLIYPGPLLQNTAQYSADKLMSLFLVKITIILMCMSTEPWTGQLAFGTNSKFGVVKNLYVFERRLMFNKAAFIYSKNSNIVKCYYDNCFLF